MSTWASRLQIRELEDGQHLAYKRIKELEDVLTTLRYSLLSRIHDDGVPREYIDSELELIEKTLGI